jgi:sugar-specific transcriptional regulator TrmB
MQDSRQADFTRLAEKLRSLNLSGYESRTYLAMVSSGPLKALDLAVRAVVPRQKIYEVLDSLVAKGFAEMIPDRPRQFAAVEPGVAFAEHLSRRRRDSEARLAEQIRLVEELHTELESVPACLGQADCVFPVIRLINDRQHAAAQFREMLAEVRTECLQFGPSPYLEGPDALQGFVSASRRGVHCRLLLDGQTISGTAAGDAPLPAGLPLEVRRGCHLPLRMTIFDAQCGLLTLDPAALVFDHPGLGAALRGLFEDFWRRESATGGGESGGSHS